MLRLAPACRRAALVLCLALLVGAALLRPVTSSASALKNCGTIKNTVGGKYTGVRVSGMTCKDARAVIAKGGPVLLHWKCTIRNDYRKQTFSPRCVNGTRLMTYTGKIVTGKV